MKQNVSIASDRAKVLWFTIHDGVSERMMKKKLWPHVEMETTMLWPPGFSAGQNKLTTSVKHQGLDLALGGHDCGKLIPHFSAPLPDAAVNIALPMLIGASSRKVRFSASRVKMNGAPAGLSDLLAWVPTPMTACGTPLATVSFPLSNVTNTVHVGVSGKDLALGYAAMAVEALFGVVGSIADRGAAVGSGGAQASLPSPGSVLFGDISGFGKKNAIAIATGLVKYATTGKVDFELGGGGVFEAKVTIKEDAKGRIKVTTEKAAPGVKLADEHDTSRGVVVRQETTDGSVLLGTGPTTTKTATAPDGTKTVTTTRSEVDRLSFETKTTKTTRKYDKDGELVEVNGKPVSKDNPAPPADPIGDAQAAMIGDDPWL